MFVYTLEQRWKVDRLIEDADFGKKKNYRFRWSSFWSWRVCKQAKLSHLGYKKAYAPKKSHCLVWILVQRHNWAFFSKISKEMPLQSMAIVIGPCWMNFCSQKLKRRILATFDLNTTSLRATQPQLHSLFCVLFLKIALSTAELMSFDHLGAVIWHRWTIICGVPSKIGVTPTSQKQLTP